MARTCYLIKKADDITAVVSVHEAIELAKKQGANLVVTCVKDLERMNNSALVTIFNKTLEKFAVDDIQPVTRFETRSAGARRVMDMLEITYGKHVRRQPKQWTGKDVRAGKGINLAARDFRKSPKPGSKRSQVMILLSRDDGATLNEILNVVGRDKATGHDHARVFIHDLNRRCGYGIKTVETTPGNPRFKIIL